MSWPAPSPAARHLAELDPAALHVWATDLTLDDRVAIERHLSRDEMARSERFRSSADRDRWLASQLFLRSVLAGYLDIEPAALQFRFGAAGKPRLAESELCFNLAHSQDRAVVAVTRAAEVGIDLEAVVACDDLDDLAQRFFTTGEAQDISQYEGDGLVEAFFRCWTRKEALVKADGGGLNIPLDAFRVTVGPHAELLEVAPGWSGLKRFSLLDVSVWRGFACAVAVKAGKTMPAVRVEVVPSD